MLGAAQQEEENQEGKNRPSKIFKLSKNRLQTALKTTGNHDSRSPGKNVADDKM